MKKLTSLVVGSVAAALTFVTPAQAAVQCKGTVTAVTATPEGDIDVHFSTMQLRLCHMNGNMTIYRAAGNQSPATITPDQCKALLSLFMTAMNTGTPVTAHADRSDCNVIGIANPYPYFFAFTKS